jgi:hypothetical protein
LLTVIDGVSFDEAYSAHSEFTVAAVKLPTISVEHFIRNKLATGRTKDLADVETLRGETP